METPWVFTIAFIATFATGILLSLVRLAESSYRHILWAQINEWFGIIVEEGKGLEQKPLNSFLAKSLNLELINVILQGVTKFAEPDYNKIRKDEDDEQYGRNYFR